MTKDRQIVLMLILRMRRAKRNWLKAKADYGGELEVLLFAEFGEANNACELARRILYGYYK